MTLSCKSIASALGESILRCVADGLLLSLVYLDFFSVRCQLSFSTRSVDQAPVGGRGGFTYVGLSNLSERLDYEIVLGRTFWPPVDCGQRGVS